MTNISMSVVNMLYNWQLMRLMDSGGVAVYGVIMYVNFIFIAIFLGYSMGSAPSWAITTAPGTGWSCGGCCGRACASLPS